MAETKVATFPSGWMDVIETPARVTFRQNYLKAAGTILLCALGFTLLAFLVSPLWFRILILGFPLLFLIGALLMLCSALEVSIDLEQRTFALKTGWRWRPALVSGTLDEGVHIATEYGEFRKDFRRYGFARVVLALGESGYSQEIARFPKGGKTGQIQSSDVETAIRTAELWAEKLKVPLQNNI